MSKPAVETLPALRFDVRHIRAFLIVAEELHFGKAAERLFTSQPALSRMIRALEHGAEVALLERSTRRVRLTSAGEAFAAECHLAYGHLLRAKPAAMDAAAGRGGQLRVGYMDFAINGRLPVLLREYRGRYPDVSVEMEYNPSARQCLALLEGRLDVGFVIGEFPSQKVRSLLVDQNEYVALLPETHPLSTQSSLQLSDLAGEPFVVGTENAFGAFRRLLFPLCHNADFFPNIVQQASNTSGIMGMIAAGVGVSVYAGCVRNAVRTGVAVRPLRDIADRIPTCAIWSTENPSETLRGFTEFLVGYIREHGV